MGLPSGYVSEPLALKGAHNTRDLGGYPYVAEDGSTGVTASHVFLRSGSLTRVGAAGREMLQGYGVRRVIDVRSNFEVRYFPDPYGRRPRPGVDYIHVPMLDQLNSSGFRGALPACMFDVYRDLLDKSQDSLRRVVEASDGDGCTLFHCRVGKDRTGVIAMLLLGLAGVPDEDVVADYAATQGNMGRFLRAQRICASVALLKTVPRCLFEAAPEEMERTLRHLHATYGSAREYLEGFAGCSPDVLDRMTARMRAAAEL